MSIVPKRTRKRQGSATAIPRTPEQYRALAPRFQESLNRAAHVLTEMRTGKSLRRASIDAGIDPRTVQRLAKNSLRKTPGGKYVATKSDRLLRVLVMPTRSALAEIATKDSRQASRLSGYWNALDIFLQTGDSTALRAYDGLSVKNAQGASIPLLTDLDELERLGSAGVLSFESLYARAA